MWTSSTPAAFGSVAMAIPPFVVNASVLELQRVHQQLLARGAPRRRARRTRAHAQREAGQLGSRRRTRGSARRPAPPRARSSAPSSAVPSATSSKANVERDGHDLAQVADLQLDLVDPPPARVALAMRDHGLGDRELVHSADPRQRVADQLVHHPPAAEARSRPAPCPGGSVSHLADLGRLLAARHARAARRAPRRRARARRTRRACPRWRRTSGRCRAARRRPRPPGATGTSASRTSIATPEARASSLSTEATPPRVASRMQRSAGPAASSSASTAGHSERVSDSIVGVELELAAGEHDRRAVLADRARRRGSRSPGRSAAGDSVARGSTRPDAGRADVHAVGVAALDDLRVAGDDLDARPPRRRAAIASTSARSSSAVEALLEDQRQASARAAARPPRRGR